MPQIFFILLNSKKIYIFFKIVKIVFSTSDKGRLTYSPSSNIKFCTYFFMQIKVTLLFDTKPKYNLMDIYIDTVE